MPAHPWELRADVGPIEVAATRWTDTATVLTRRGDELIDAARRATEGWDAAAAESYERHRREVLARLDRFAQLATHVAGSLRAVSAILTSAQKELDQSWANVALVPHEVVGESRHLVFHASEDEERGKVTRGQVEADDIRRRLTVALDQESTRLRSAGAELSVVRTELTTLAGGDFRQLVAPGEEVSGVGVVSAPSTSVPGSAQAGGVSGLPPIGPLSVSTPDLSGLGGLGGLAAAAGLSSLAATAASGLAGGRDRRRTTNPVPPMGGMGAGAMGARAGTMSRGMASGRSGPHRLATPRLSGQDDDADGRLAREKEARQTEKEAKQAALAQKRAERAARRAEREAERGERDPSGTAEPDDELDDDLDDELDADLDAELDGDPDAAEETAAETDGKHPAPRR